MTSTPKILNIKYYEQTECDIMHPSIREEETVDDFTVGVDSDDETTNEDVVDSDVRKKKDCLDENLDCCCGDNVRGVRDCACCLKQCTCEIYSGCRHIDYKGLAKNTFNVKSLKSKFPILKWLPKYRLNYFIGDLIAGLTVGLTQIPKSLAMAKIALLPPQYGMYSATFCVFVYIFFGGAKDMNLGPQSVQSLLVGQFGQSPIEGDASYAIALSFMCGLVQFAMGVFHLGFLVNYISYPVLESFTTASVITVAFSQVPSWLGLKDIPKQFPKQVYWTFKRLPEAHIWDFILGLVSMIVIYLIGKLNTTSCMKRKCTSRLGRAIKYIVWLCVIARNVVVVILGLVAAYVFHLYGYEPFGLTRNIPAGLPPFKPPAFSVSDGNTTYSATDMLKTMGTGILFVPIISYISVMAIAKNFARKGNYKVDKDQELIAVGAANLTGSFLSAFPITGTFSGSAVNYQSGARTPLNGVFVGIIGILVLLFLTPVFYYIPNASLSAVIITSVVDLINFNIVIKLWNVKKIDLLPWFVTFFGCLGIGIELGIVLGMAVSICILIFPVSRPKVRTVVNEGRISLESSPAAEYALLVIQQGLAFPSVEHFLDTVMSRVLEGGKTRVYRSVILDFVHVPSVDFTIVQGLEELTEDFKILEISLVLCRVRPSVQNVLRRCGIKNLDCAKDVEEAIQMLQSADRSQMNENEEHPNGAIFTISSNLGFNDDESDDRPTEHTAGSSSSESSADSKSTNSTEETYTSTGVSPDYLYSF